ncbi:hypothetical protein pb186bvf_003649 [Paramecium bursaria]
MDTSEDQSYDRILKLIEYVSQQQEQIKKESNKMIKLRCKKDELVQQFFFSYCLGNPIVQEYILKQPQFVKPTIEKEKVDQSNKQFEDNFIHLYEQQNSQEKLIQVQQNADEMIAKQKVNKDSKQDLNQQNQNREKQQCTYCKKYYKSYYKLIRHQYEKHNLKQNKSILKNEMKNIRFDQIL